MIIIIIIVIIVVIMVRIAVTLCYFGVLISMVFWVVGAGADVSGQRETFRDVDGEERKKIKRKKKQLLSVAG